MAGHFTVLGGSSPFTVALIDAIRNAPVPLNARELRLYGRNREHLELIEGYSRAHLADLGWTVRATTQCTEALDGAACILHQVRYGGMAARAADDRLALEHGVAADETLGPSALCAAIRTLPELTELAELLKRNCPQAWVLNLTNPLSVTTAVLSVHGIRCAGLCELPQHTLEEVCSLLRLPTDEVTWSYHGLNHRGFIHQLDHAGRDCLEELGERFPGKAIGGIPTAEISRLGAIPLKYFNLLRGAGVAAPGRADFLMELQENILSELRSGLTNSPPSLARRYTAWYPRAVVPMLSAIDANNGDAQVVNCLQPDGIVWEQRARIYADRLDFPAAKACGQPICRWIELFRDHERAVLAAAWDPCRETIAGALELDPIVPKDQISRLLDAIECVRPASFALA